MLACVQSTGSRGHWGRAAAVAALLGCQGPEGSGAGESDDDASDTATDTGGDGSGTDATDTSGSDTGTDDFDLGAPSTCGDGVIDDGEQCDDGDDNGSYEACNDDCSGPGPHCGDAAVDAPEECDDGNDDGLDDCSNLCRAHACGDQVAQAGDLCFDPVEEHTPTHDPGPILVLDLDQDSHLDLVIGDVSAGEVVVTFGDGLGGLLGAQSHAGPELVHHLVATDFDGDGDVDVLAVGRTQGYVALLGDGQGGLAVLDSSSALTTGGTAAQFDSGGLADLALGSDGNTQIRLGAGDGTFALHETMQHAGWISDWGAPADLDGDTLVDLVLALDESGADAPIGELRTLRGLGDGDFAPIQTFELADDADRVVTADLDADDLPDVIALRGGQPCEGANKDCGGGAWLHPSLGEITVYCSEELEPGLLELTSSVVVGFDPSDIAAGDLDRDGRVDVVATHFSFGWLELLRGDGAGGLDKEIVDDVGFRHVDVELADLDEDEVPDIILSRAALGEDPGAIRIRLSSP